MILQTQSEALGHPKTQDWQRMSLMLTFLTNHHNQRIINGKYPVFILPYYFLQFFHLAATSCSNFFIWQPPLAHEALVLGGNLLPCPTQGMGPDEHKQTSHSPLLWQWLAHGWAYDLSWSSQGEFPELCLAFPHRMRMKRPVAQITIGSCYMSTRWNIV